MAAIYLLGVQLMLLVAFGSNIFVQSHPKSHLYKTTIPKAIRASPPDRNFTLDNGTASTYVVELKYLPEASMLNGFRQYHCYVNVKVFKSSKQSYTASNVDVFALVIEPSISKQTGFIGYTKAVTDSNGNACVRTICRKNAIIIADTGVERLNLVIDQRLPVKLNRTIPSFTEMMLTDINQIPNFFDPPGPVYQKGYLPECKNPQSQAFYIGFHFLGLPDTSYLNPNASEFSYEEAWYPLREGEPGYKVCYIKINVKTSIYNISIAVNSYNNQSNYFYGRKTSGPKEDPTANDNGTNRAACIEYRCPFENPENNEIISTRLEGALTVPPSVHCRNSKTSPDFQSGVFNITNSNFEISLTPLDDYGPNAGIYFTGNRKIARSLCFTGANDIIDNYEMNPNTGYAFQFICEKKSVNIFG